MSRDWLVWCQCGAEYTPKADSQPEECYECGGTQLVAFPLCKDCTDPIKYRPSEDAPWGARCASCCLDMMSEGAGQRLADSVHDVVYGGGR